MNIITIILIALALAMDSFAVSIASGITIKNLRIRHALTIAAWFGLFQALMPLLGWLGGIKIKDYICCVDHWIAFALLSFIGCKMIYEAFKLEKIEKRSNPLDIYVLFVLSVATSIDAFTAGISFAMLGVQILTPILIIGIVTFVMSFAGTWIGNKSGHFFEKKIEIIGGIMLIAIGLKILIQH
jgi:putative Mn2+ efflux pump MntP